MKPQSFATIVHGYFLDYLPQQKGLQPSSIRSYRDSLRLFLIFVAGLHHRGVSELALEHLDYQSVLAFLRNMEKERGNAITTRNQRLAALHTFYEYIGRKVPGDAPVLRKGRGHSDEALPSARDEVPGARGRRGFVRRRPRARQALDTGSCLVDGALQHGRSRLRSRPTDGRSARPPIAGPGTATGQRCEMAKLPSMGPDCEGVADHA